MIWFYVSVALVVTQLIILVKSNSTRRPVLITLGVCQFYYSVCGPLYWVFVQDSVYVGVDWGADRIFWSGATLSFATFLASLVIAWPSRNDHVDALYKIQLHGKSVPRCWFYFAATGLISSMFVLMVGSLSGDAVIAMSNPAFLIAYQFSDIMIPALVFIVVKRGYSLTSVVLISYFIVYASMVGFRYKIALLLVPLFVISVARDASFKAWIKRGFCLTAAFLWLGALTIVRVKFSAPDFSGAAGTDWIETAAYGFFAESNILFGLQAIENTYMRAGVYIGPQPILDFFLELVPRALLPEKKTGEYLATLLFGLMSDEGLGSHTAYPFVGEFMMMGGWAGALVGTVLYGGFYRTMHFACCRMGLGRRDIFGGLGLIAAVIGYYHFSRGYLPQAGKAYLFVLVPYLAMVWTEKQRTIRLLGRIISRTAAKPPIRKKMASEHEHE